MSTSPTHSPIPALKTPPELGWVTVPQAAAQLGCAESTIRQLTRRGQVDSSTKERLWVNAESLKRHTVEEARWCTFIEAARIIGCDPHHVDALARAGLLSQRKAARAKPSILREDAAKYAPTWARCQQERAQARQDREERRAAVAAPTDPPDDGQAWLNTQTAALVLGISASAVQQKAASGRLPCLKRSNRRWYRRIDVEVAAAARAFTQRTPASDQR